MTITQKQTKMAKMQTHSLRFTRILLTRPTHQAHALTSMIEAVTGEVILFPTIAIEPISDRSFLTQAINQLNKYSIVIFMSANAVNYCSDLLHQSWVTCDCKPLLATIGPATTTALIKLGLPVTITPNNVYNSEALLALTELQNSANKSILIISGADGRDVLAKSLGQRGAIVTTAIAYQRSLPQIDVTPLINSWQQQGMDIIVCTSSHSLKNLYTLLQDSKYLLLQTPLIVISQSMLAYANALGWQVTPIVAKDATDEAIFTALKLWRQKNHAK
ncbi:uroporphyrinogen-III synthase [soil metagenome]